MSDLAPAPATPAPTPTAPKSPIPSSAPAPAAPVATPSAAAPAPAAEAPKPKVGMNDFISKLGKPSEAPKADAAPDTKPTDPAKPAEPAAPTGDDIWDKAPLKQKNAHFQYKRETETKLQEYDRKIKELEGKSSQSPADLKKIQELEERASKLEKEIERRENLIAETSYERSAAYKKDHLDKWDEAAARIGKSVSVLKVKSTDADGNVTERPANGADLDKLRSMDAHSQDVAVNEMFGSSAYRVFAFLNELDGLERSSREAVATAKVKSDEARRDSEKKFGERSTEFKTHAERFKGDIEKNHPEYFSPDPANPEASEALKAGFEYVDSAASRQHEMTPQDLAETTTMIRYLAASAPRLMKEKTQLTSKITSLEAELSKYRKSSPGSAAPSASSPPVEKESRGIDAMIEQMRSQKK